MRSSSARATTIALVQLVLALELLLLSLVAAPLHW